ncbi:DUF4183 domain-containing protein [Priestia taiwanensis]|uniref:DUF4183 domain-containing protein n=1 Tax=Priestia taiwanensis TaxID=1347902 RepID=A0A917AI80_9BACI|nr:DUF4183 domain-containing protein [Priestia taiwanensis]MBM7361413.1 hypothetical protein [Priestia taiwanensis]GGE53945.1 hypothetical protein GCM10007140_00350 [Priestia taiwanensis]
MRSRNKQKEQFSSFLQKYSISCIAFPVIPPSSNTPRQTTCTEFITVAKGNKRIYHNEDGLTEYGPMRIVSPNDVSYINLFINGVLQPQVNYQVGEGELILLSNNLPQQGVPITLQFISIY